MLYYAFIHALWHAQSACHDFAMSMITVWCQNIKYCCVNNPVKMFDSCILCSVHLVQFSQAIECDCSFGTLCLQLCWQTLSTSSDIRRVIYLPKWQTHIKQSLRQLWFIELLFFRFVKVSWKYHQDELVCLW